MNRHDQDGAFPRTCTRNIGVLAISITLAFFPGWAASDETVEPQATESQPTEPQPIVRTHMSEELRSKVRKVIVLPTTSPVNQGIAGSYEKRTPGLLGGVEAGRRIGTIRKEIGGVVFTQSIGVLMLPGMLIGGLSGKAKERLQNFRDALTEELALAASETLSNDALASDVFWNIRSLPKLDSKVFALSTPIPADTDAILYVSLTDVIINVQESDAIITTSASATLRRMSDGAHVYDKQVEYTDQGELTDWTDNENALWKDYANFARHYIGREISAEVFERVVVQHELRPKETDTVSKIKKNEWQAESRSLSPTLAWELTLQGGDAGNAWVGSIGEADIAYDVEIYDLHRLVYSAKKVPDPRHTVAVELEPCNTFRWTVRPSYQVDGDTKYGEWMRFDTDTESGNGGAGGSIVEAPAYLRDFASLEIDCRRRR